MIKPKTLLKHVPIEQRDKPCSQCGELIAQFYEKRVSGILHRYRECIKCNHIHLLSIKNLENGTETTFNDCDDDSCDL